MADYCIVSLSHIVVKATVGESYSTWGFSYGIGGSPPVAAIIARLRSRTPKLQPPCAGTIRPNLTQSSNLVTGWFEAKNMERGPGSGSPGPKSGATEVLSQG